jgi:glyoxylase I family protein
MTGSNAAIGGGGFHHVAMYVRDYDASVKFSTEVLGFTVRLTWGTPERRCCLLDTGDGNYFELSANPKREESMPARGTMHIALRSNDVDASIERARAAGAPISVEPKDVVFNSEPPLPVRIGFCEGPDGESIEFFSNKLT